MSDEDWAADFVQCLGVRQAGDQFPLYGRSLALLRTVRPEQSADELTSTQLETLRREATGPTITTPAPHARVLVH